MVDFFGQQEQARRQTTRLVILFAMAVLLIIVAVYLAVSLGLLFADLFQGGQGLISVQTLWQPTRFGWVSLLTIMVIAGGSWYRLYSLKQGGGRAVAEMLAASRIPAASADPLLRRLLNVVEEMAIASGLPVPPVYLLNEAGINAFAAGFSPADAVIAVTQGAVELLERDELQGVVAHEFSHILNGDMRLKMYLTGVLFGITLISDAGIMLLSSRRSVAYSNDKRGTHPALLVIGFLLFLAGTAGVVFADLIKRAVSRQREFLADAAAVQFTRNPAGLAGALKVIAGYSRGARVAHPAARQASHFFFGNAMKEEGSDWWASHPPLLERIRRLQPGFQGRIEPVQVAARSTHILDEAVHAMAGITTNAPPVAGERSHDPVTVVDSIGQPDCELAQGILAELPAALRGFARDPYMARAMVYCLLLDSEAAIRGRQLDVLQTQADAAVFGEVLDIYPRLAAMDIRMRIPLLELLMPALKELSLAQYQQFRANTMMLIHANHEVSMFEFMLQRMVERHVSPAFEPVQPAGNRPLPAGEVLSHLAVVVAMLIRLGHHRLPESVYRDAMRQYGTELVPPMPGREICTMERLDRALHFLRHGMPSMQKKIVTVCTVAVMADGRVSGQAQEMLRAICDALETPLPPWSLA
ncbi:peptidase M48 [Mariprofundus erugo]|uniref:Peptidase M48 n=1 Tax=Mariprofundus erugo TaxID=2528639 RepID=A0A5R9GTH1_9PROT|nr:M48 family metallopeptidase [Mariprofundus erugo]TLS67567.1 peptidase M48 [Mariprofundus erugo]